MGKPEHQDVGSAAIPVASNNPFRRLAGKLGHQSHDDNASNAQSGYSASNTPTSETYAPPPGPPPGYGLKKDTYAPPPGPPPKFNKTEQYAPPPGPPPSHDPAPPPYENWFAIPDNSSLPPPPTVAYDASPTANSSADLAAQGRSWTAANPLYPPCRPSPQTLNAILRGEIRLCLPPAVNRHCTFSNNRPGTTLIRSSSKTPDTSLLSELPLYIASRHNPSNTHKPYTIYFELRILRLDLSSSRDAEVASAVAIGFAAPPYPTFRLPGWERASLAVHSDDGRRYINDNCGGRDFTTSFKPGETVGLGMTFRPGHGWNRIECFLTQEGKKVDSWDLWEERDQQDAVGDPAGLGGERDICAAVGFWGKTEVEFRARRDEWLYRPEDNWDLVR